MTGVAVVQPQDSNAPAGPHPTLFCWCHMKLDTHHEELIQSQYKRRAGIFACNDHAVVSSAKKVIVGGEGDGEEDKVETWFNPDFKNGYNTKSFLSAWNILWGSGKIWPYDFVVKVDPETVFFPYRLRAKAQDYVSQSVYFPNCGDFTSEGGPKMLGAVEVFSIPAMHEFMSRLQECISMPWDDLGEDEFMKRCMDRAGVRQTEVLQLSDPRCNTIPCSDASFIAYGGHNTSHQWMQCFDDSKTTTVTTTTTSTNTTTSTSTWTTTFTTTTPPGPRPWIFCWSHMEFGAYEEPLIRLQFTRRVSIFACNDYAVIASKRWKIGEIDGVPVETWFNPESKVGMGKYGVNGQKTDSYLNTKTFIDNWDTLMNSGRIWIFDFVVKVDPDAVFFPHRLIPRLEDHIGEVVYVPNCGKWASGPKLYGSIEVFSVPALRKYQEREKDCKNLPWSGWGEDYYMQHCMDLLGAKQVNDFNQVGDDRCIGAPCSDWTKVAFHPFKNVSSWFQCQEESKTTTTFTATETSTSTVTKTTSTSTFTTTAVKGPSPKLFCWSHMESGSYEEGLIEMQFKRRANIFACNGYAVISKKRSVIGHIDNTSVETWYNPEDEVKMGEYGVNGQKTDSFLNTGTFVMAWDTLINSGQIWAYDFIIKVDPDAVYFPDRIRKRLEDHVGKKVYVPNCGKWASGPKLYGSVEVFSVPAVAEYARRIQECKALPWQGWGEDYYMQHCMDMLGVMQVADFEQVGDDRCVPAPCSDWTRVAYHDFKTLDSWMDCFRTAIGEK